ncbi:hypothetical protein [Neorhodopirellula lusitana]|uniref:hypothetical protein n=1 Tax=Neorhodopirellula lusitana TaxID=445327 RepID=UPI00384DA59A
MFCRQRYHDLARDAEAIKQVRYGRIITQQGKLVAVERHWLSSPASIAQVWWESNRGRIRGDLCHLDFHIPGGVSGFITLDYVRSGSETSYKTFLGACNVLNEVARLRNAQAIVAHITNGRISDRLLERQGWERHMLNWRGRHFIRRFLDGYPELQPGRY